MNSTKILVWTIVTMLVATVALPLSLTAQSTLGPTSSPTVIAAMANAREGSSYLGRLSRWTGAGPMTGARQRLSRSPSQSANSKITVNEDDVKYKVVPVGALPGKSASFITAGNTLNNLGHAVGYSYVNICCELFQTAQAFIWENGKLKALPLLSGWVSTLAFAINDRDQVIGEANNVDSAGNVHQIAILWDHGPPVSLGTLFPGSNSYAIAINFWGVVVGASDIPGGTGFTYPAAWYGGTIHALPLLPGMDNGFAESINDFGVIVGRQAPSDGSSQIPCLWYWNGTGYTPISLGSFGGDFGDAIGINNLGQAVGGSTFPRDLHGSAFEWDFRGLHALRALPGDTDGLALAISDRGQIVGFSQLCDDNFNCNQPRFVSWQDGTPTDLQTVVPAGTPTFTNVGNANRRGEISIDSGYIFDGTIAGYVLIPIDN